MIEKRNQIVRALESGAPVQPEAIAEIVVGLRALNGGRVVPLFAPNKGRRGRTPDIVAECQLKILKWKRYQQGKGRKVGDIEAELETALNCSATAMKKWQRKLEKVYGKEHVAMKLDLAEEVGRLEAKGETVASLSRHDSNEDERLFRAIVSLDQNLGDLANARRAATKKRRVPHSPGK